MPEGSASAVTYPGDVSRIVVLDYGSGNLRSAERALRRVGADVTVTADRHAALEADGLVVPGVGAFAACMAGLRAVDGPSIIDHRLAGGRPVLGICVGMQVLFDRGVEWDERTDGCAQWPGTGAAVDLITTDRPLAAPSWRPGGGVLVFADGKPRSRRC